MFIKRFAVITLSLMVVLVGVLAACAAPTPSPTLTTTPTLTPTATPTGPLAQVIEGAKKEGAVTAKLKSTLTPKSMERLQREIKETFGVDLKINFTPTTSQDLDCMEAIMEYKAGATPSYDLNALSDVYSVQAFAAGALEIVDWKPLITQDTNPKVVIEHPLMRGAILNYTSHSGLMYNPDKIRADELPKTVTDLANPKWTGKVAIQASADAWARGAFIMGKEKTIADLRAVLQNKAVLGARYADLYNRYLLGEVWMAYRILSSYVKSAQDKGMPAGFQGLDYMEVANFPVDVRKGAAHPNAAKLVAIYLASPAGAKFMLEEGAAGNSLYPGNFENDIKKQAESQALPIYARETYPGLLEFQLSDEFIQWTKEFDVILKTKG